MRYANWKMLLGMFCLLVLQPGIRAQDNDPIKEGDTKKSSSTFGHDEEWSLTFGAGLAMYGGNAGWTMSSGILNRLGDVGSPLYWGLDAGLNFWMFTSPTGATSQGATGVFLLPSILYALDFGQSSRFRPYLGLMIGPHLYLERTVSAGGVATSSSRVYLQMMFRPGANISLTESVSLNIEPKVGILGTNFIFMPTASAVFPL